MRLRTSVNGVVMQDSSTSDMIFTVEDLVSFLSQGMTLSPGTVILTGTPPGAGAGRNPPFFLQPGDEVTVSGAGIGELVSPVVAGA